MVIHLGDTKGTFYREADGDVYHLGRAQGQGGLDGEDFFDVDVDAASRLTDEVVRYLAAEAGPPVAAAPQDVEMLRALGYAE